MLQLYISLMNDWKNKRQLNSCLYIFSYVLVRCKRIVPNLFSVFGTQFYNKAFIFNVARLYTSFQITLSKIQNRNKKTRYKRLFKPFSAICLFVYQYLWIWIKKAFMYKINMISVRLEYLGFQICVL